MYVIEFASTGAFNIMKIDSKFRQFVPESRRIVVKVGTRVLSDARGRPTRSRIASLVSQIAELKRSGYEVVLVSSGSIGAGMASLGIGERPKSVPDLQMCAAVGQARLIAMYEEVAHGHKLKIGQMLLTYDDFASRLRTGNARRTMEHLLRNGVLPVVNENDVVADEEIKAYLSLGDNDYLAALVVKLIRADLLVILSTVDGLLDMSAARPKRIPCLQKLDKAAFALVAPPGPGGISKGGMDSKLRAASLASKAGCSVIIADGRKGARLVDAVLGRDVGTIIPGSTI